MPNLKATYWQEKVSDLFIVATTANRNLIYKYAANTSSLTWRGCVMTFEPETCLYVNSTPKPNIREKSFWIFQNGALVTFQKCIFLFANKTMKNCFNEKVKTQRKSNYYTRWTVFSAILNLALEFQWGKSL